MNCLIQDIRGIAEEIVESMCYKCSQTCLKCTVLKAIMGIASLGL